MSLTLGDVLERIVKARKEKGWDQAKLGEKMHNRKFGGVGMSGEAVRKIEKGIEPLDVNRLLDIADALGKPASWFFEEDDKTVEKSEPQEERIWCDSVGDLIRIIEAYEHATQDPVKIGKHARDIEEFPIMFFKISGNLETCLSEYLLLRDGAFSTISEERRAVLLHGLRDGYSMIPLSETDKDGNIFADDQEGK